MKIEIIENQNVEYRDLYFKEDACEGNILLPLYGKVYCGAPNSIDDYKEEILEIPQHMLGSGEYFALRAEGDSMIDAGISDGDILIIKMQNYAENGQIVVARIGQNVTLKRIFMLDDEKKIKLCPENKLYKEIITDECDIMGVATKIIKDVEET